MCRLVIVECRLRLRRVGNEYIMKNKFYYYYYYFIFVSYHECYVVISHSNLCFFARRLKHFEPCALLGCYADLLAA